MVFGSASWIESLLLFVLLILCCMGLSSRYYNAYHLSPLPLYFLLMEEKVEKYFSY